MGGENSSEVPDWALPVILHKANSVFPAVCRMDVGFCFATELKCNFMSSCNLSEVKQLLGKTYVHFCVHNKLAKPKGEMNPK